MTSCTFVSDIHLRLLKNTEFESNRFIELGNLLSKTNTETIILGGDIFDVPKPTVYEIGLFYDFIDILNKANKIVYVISGNHENLSDRDTTFDYLPEIGFTYFKNHMIPIKGYNLYFVSHISCKAITDLKETIVSNKTNILFTHFRSNFGNFIKGEINTKEVSNMFDYCFVGDIHHKYSPYDNIFYPSSPYGIHYETLRDFGIYHLYFEGKLRFSYENLHLPSKILLSLSPKDAQDKTNYSQEHLYKVVISGDDNTQIREYLNKIKNITKVEFSGTPQEDEELFDSLVDELSTHKEEDLIGTLTGLLESRVGSLEESEKQYFRGLLHNAQNK